jgi:hypothetical protein
MRAWTNRFSLFSTLGPLLLIIILVTPIASTIVRRSLQDGPAAAVVARDIIIIGPNASSCHIIVGIRR